MESKFKKKPRKFVVGKDSKVTISDFGKIHLDPDEMVSFITVSGKEYDVTSKNWGFYATPSLNGRLRAHGFKTALVKNKFNKYYIMLVEEEKVEDFFKYLNSEENFLVKWLDEYE